MFDNKVPQAGKIPVWFLHHLKLDLLQGDAFTHAIRKNVSIKVLPSIVHWRDIPNVIDEHFVVEKLVNRNVSSIVSTYEEVKFLWAEHLADIQGKRVPAEVSSGFGEGKLIYIAGPMTGLPEYNYPAFRAAADILRDEDWKVLDTAGHLPAGLDEAFYMRIALAYVVEADAIYMLLGWEQSKGAIAEHALAEKLGLEIIYQEEH